MKLWGFLVLPSLCQTTSSHPFLRYALEVTGGFKFCVGTNSKYHISLKIICCKLLIFKITSWQQFYDVKEYIKLFFQV